MRLIRMFGVAAVAAVAAMALVGASSASATTTQLCKEFVSPCPVGKAVQELHILNVGSVVLLSGTANVLCLSSLGKAEALALGAPQSIHFVELTFAGCGTNAAHNNCEVRVLGPFLVHLLRTAANLGEADLRTMELFVKCVIGAAVIIECEYRTALSGFTVPLHTVGAGGAGGHGMFTATALSFAGLGVGMLCPPNPKLDALYEPLEDIYVVA